MNPSQANLNNALKYKVCSFLNIKYIDGFLGLHAKVEMFRSFKSVSQA